LFGRFTVRLLCRPSAATSNAAASSPTAMKKKKKLLVELSSKTVRSLLVWLEARPLHDGRRTHAKKLYLPTGPVFMNPFFPSDIKILMVLTVTSLLSLRGRHVLALSSSLSSSASLSSSSSGAGKRAFVIRPAERSDVAWIHSINNQYLPEKYSLDFLFTHYDGFPKLAFVAEDPTSAKLVGYALGRIKVASGGNLLSHLKPPTPFFVGHISSVCVRPDARGCGVAQALMSSLHKNFDTAHGVRAVTLHCRCSNQAAINLYNKRFGYRCAERISRYYDDGEDAWLMMIDDVRRAGGDVSAAVGTRGVR
jgi:[ribosomal protein S18]-alanine N-acetyltransferase